MLNYLQRIKFLILALLMVLLIFMDCRVLFYFFNKASFPNLGFLDFIKISFYGLRFDIAALFFINALFILLLAIPYSPMHNRAYRLTAKTIFVLFNTVAVLANCSDFVYFQFTFKRTTFDVFRLMGEQSEFRKLLPVFIMDYWYVFVLCILHVLLLVYCYNRMEKKFHFQKTKPGARDFVYQFISFGFVFGFTTLGMRGGLQLIPVSLVNAGDNVENQYIPLVLNTPFTLVKSTELNTFDEKHYYSEKELNQLFDPVKNKTFKDTVPFNKENIVIIILESFSKEYTGLGKRKSYTPFLDSLMKESLVFTNAYANGKRSIEGIPAILAAMPSFSKPYVNTIYSSNKIQSFASILKNKGYTSSFFHGGTNGTMSFDSFCKLAGFDQYFGRTEYNNEADYDGRWGIWDEAFLQFYAARLNEMQEPFVSSVFTLSSHHPFNVPAKYKDKFPKGKMPILECIAYTDFALKGFFESVKKSAWYNNTLFVITADHTGLSEDPFYSNPVGNFQIPLLFYKANSSLKGTDTTFIQQIDILPTVLAHTHYDKPYFAFGNNAFEKQGYCINMSSNLYQLYAGNNLLTFDGEKTTGFFNFKTDSLLIRNIPGQHKAEQELMEKKIKAFIQCYNNTIIHNTTFFP